MKTNQIPEKKKKSMHFKGKTEKSPKQHLLLLVATSGLDRAPNAPRVIHLLSPMAKMTSVEKL